MQSGKQLKRPARSGKRTLSRPLFHGKSRALFNGCVTVAILILRVFHFAILAFHLYGNLQYRCASSIVHRGGGSAVSYTHLDVYKRQGVVRIIIQENHGKQMNISQHDVEYKNYSRMCLFFKAYFPWEFQHISYGNFLSLIHI